MPFRYRSVGAFWKKGARFIRVEIKPDRRFIKVLAE